MLAWPFCVALLATANAPAAPESEWYRGLIGRTATALDTPERYQQNKEVELQLRVDGSTVTGSYFYFDAGKGDRGADIVLQGRAAPDGTLRFEEKGDGSRVTGRWQGVTDGQAFSGTWTDPTGRRTLKFLLRRLPDDESQEQAVAPGVAYRGRRVVGTNLVLPFLSQHPSPAVMDQVNNQIRGAFEGHRCSPSVAFPAWPDDYNVVTKVTYASRDLLSVSVSEEWFCGAAYPSTEDRSFTFDLRTGKPIAFEDLFREYEKNRGPILAALFAEALKSASAECKELAASDTGPGPHFLSGKFVFHLSATTLHARETDLVHAVQACGVHAEVPYDRLRRLVAPDGPIARIMAKAQPTPSPR